MEEDKKTLIFGLNPSQAIINSISLMALSQVMWAFNFVQQFPIGTTFNEIFIKEKFKVEDNFPWYYSLIILIILFISVLLFNFWVGFKFKLDRKNNFFKYLLLTLIFNFSFSVLVTIIFRYIFLLLFLKIQ